MFRNPDLIFTEYSRIISEYKQQTIPALNEAKIKFIESKNNVRAGDEIALNELTAVNAGIKLELSLKLIQLDYFYNEKLANLFSANVYKSVQSDVNGYYEFDDIPYGKYYLLAEFKVFDSRAEWLELVEVQQKETKCDLTNNNAKDVYMHLSEEYRKK